MYIDAMWKKLRKNSSLRCILAPKYDEDANPMANKIPNVKFILETLAGSLVALTAEGNLLLEDSNFENRTWADASPIDQLILVENPSGKIKRVLRLNVLCGNP